MLLDLLDESISYAESVLAGIPQGMGEAPTPCPEFTVDHLAEHLVNGLAWYAGLPGGGETDPVKVAGPDVRAVGYAPALNAVATAARANWTQAQLASTFAMPFGNVTGAGITEFTVVEVLVHAWDLAAAAGQPVRPAADLAERVLDVARALPEETLRAPGMMAAAVPVPDDAPALDRLLAHLGRRP